GAIVVFAKNVAVSGTVNADAENGGTGFEGNRGANGGGGAGGSIFVKAETANLGYYAVTARRGAGGMYGSGSEQD
ncbi:hypothetical protein NY536_16160, partial [Enterobacter hormaechei]|nr:hypothetical protein [Enterobacter hormaechei]